MLGEWVTAKMDHLGRRGFVGVLALVLLRVVLGSRSAPMLVALRTWLLANNAVIMAVLLLVIGAMMGVFVSYLEGVLGELTRPS